MGSEKEAPSFVSQLAPKTYGLGQLDRLLLSAQRKAEDEVASEDEIKKGVPIL